MRRPLTAILLLLGLTLFGPHDIHAETLPDQAAAFVTNLGNTAINVLGARDVSLSDREAEVRHLLKKSFALNQIGKFVLGRAWRKASDDQKREYLGLFAEYVLTIYTKRLGGYSGESFRITRAEPIGKQDALVTTRIERPGGPPLKAGWRVRQMSGQYRIIDVVVEGVSMAAAQRAEFASIVQTQGVEGLLQTLRLHVSKFSAQAS